MGNRHEIDGINRLISDKKYSEISDLLYTYANRLVVFVVSVWYS